MFKYFQNITIYSKHQRGKQNQLIIWYELYFVQSANGLYTAPT